MEWVPENLRDGEGSKVWLHIENALKYIEEHFSDEDLSNERISEAIGVSPNYLTKRFRACFDMPLHRYVVRTRIERAQRMLLSGNCNITEAAVAAGFSSIHVLFQDVQIGARHDSERLYGERRKGTGHAAAQRRRAAARTAQARDGAGRAGSAAGPAGGPVRRGGFREGAARTGAIACAGAAGTVETYWEANESEKPKDRV